MNITYYGHACFSIKIGDNTILFDPFITPNELASSIDIKEINAEYILVSHGHEDHIADVLEIAKNTGAKLISNFEIVTWFGNKGVENGHPMNHGGSWSFEFGKVKYVNAVHSSTLPDGSSGGNPGGFIIEANNGFTFYYAGDTALHYDMKLIGEGYDLDFAILPLGDNFTMGVNDAIKAAEFIQCKKIIGMHYDTFGYIKIDHSESIQKFKNAGTDLSLLKIGETISI
jgi:L-ascorbate metabolism protein UlaG (beta-lactamase superfamily)